MCSGAQLSRFSRHCFGLSPVPWQFRSSSPILQSSWPSQSHFSEMQRLLRHWNWSSAQRSSQPRYNQTQLKHRISDNSYVKTSLQNKNTLSRYHSATETAVRFQRRLRLSGNQRIFLFSCNNPGNRHGGDT